MRNSNIDEIN